VLLRGRVGRVDELGAFGGSATGLAQALAKRSCRSAGGGRSAVDDDEVPEALCDLRAVGVPHLLLHVRDGALRLASVSEETKSVWLARGSSGRCPLLGVSWRGR